MGVILFFSFSSQVCPYFCNQNRSLAYHHSFFFKSSLSVRLISIDYLFLSLFLTLQQPQTHSHTFTNMQAHPLTHTHPHAHAHTQTEAKRKLGERHLSCCQMPGVFILKTFSLTLIESRLSLGEKSLPDAFFRFLNILRLNVCCQVEDRVNFCVVS